MRKHRKYRSRSRRRYKKKYRKTLRRVKKTKRIIGRKRLSGNSKKISNKTENKTITYYCGPQEEGNIPAVGANPGVIWCTDNAVVNVIGQTTFPQVVQGVGYNQAVGNRFYYRYVDVRFMLGVENPEVPIDIVRLMIVTQRSRESDYTTNLYTNSIAGHPGWPQNLNIPIEPKLWKIHYDKMLMFKTGYQNGHTNGLFTDINDPAGQSVQTDYAGQSADLTSNKNFRLIIPFKQQVTLLGAVEWVPELKTYILVHSQYGLCGVRMLVARHYFKDP